MFFFHQQRLNFKLFKLWIYFELSILIFIILVLIFNFNIFFFFFIYTEVLWINLFFFSLLCGSYTDDPRFVFIGIIILLLASIEIVCTAFYLSFQTVFEK